MGRGRGKGKKQLVAHDDKGSGDDEKLPVRRRGRPQKSLKEDIEDEDEVEKMEEEDDENIDNLKNLSLNKGTQNQAAIENGRKRKRPSHVKESADLVKEENGVVTKMNGTDLIKSVGFRQNGSRRKNKPRRAAEVGVECK